MNSGFLGKLLLRQTSCPASALADEADGVCMFKLKVYWFGYALGKYIREGYQFSIEGGEIASPLPWST